MGSVGRHRQLMLQTIQELLHLQFQTFLRGRCIGRKWLGTECIRIGPRIARVRRCSLNPDNRSKRRASKIWMSLRRRWGTCNCSTIQMVRISTAIFHGWWKCLSEGLRDAVAVVTSKLLILILLFFYHSSLLILCIV